MRVIRTEMYFDNVHGIGEGALKAARMNPGVGVAFFGGDVPPQFPARLLLSAAVDIEPGDERTIHKYIDLSIRGVEKSFGHFSSRYRRGAIQNHDIIEYILNAGIVVEESPPALQTLKSILSKSPGIAIGTYVGMELAGSNPELMVLTVPFGIIIVGSAIGVSKGLERGLNKKIESFLTKRHMRG